MTLQAKTMLNRSSRKPPRAYTENPHRNGTREGSTGEGPRKAFYRLYGTLGRVWRAPGRVNLIGEHTDYNDGFVMPVAIDFSTWVVAAPRQDRVLRVHSVNFNERRELSLEDIPLRDNHWSRYVQAVVASLSSSGIALQGANLLIWGDVPIGGGLSSSASLEVAVAHALLGISGKRLEKVRLARLCQKAENEFVGARCGIMDPFVACCAMPGRALMLDCRSLDFKTLPLPVELKIVVCNTLVKHALAAGEYNARREECEAALKILSRRVRGAKALRDISQEQLEAGRKELPEKLYRRCRHVIDENARVLEASGALKRRDWTSFGRLMSESHRSLRNDYEVSCPELDCLVDLASDMDGVYGSRMTGGGFGGCTVNLVEASHVEEFRRAVSLGYEEAFGREPEIYVCSAAAGAGPVSTIRGASAKTTEAADDPKRSKVHA